MNVEKCEHEETKTEVTKSAVYIVCANPDCGKRLERVDEGAVIEKVVIPEVMEKRWKN